MFRQKAKNIIGLATKLVSEHRGEVPRTLRELVELPGVGRKTANVVLGVAFNTPEGVVVDTHVQRISQRLGWTKHTTPDKIEPDLMALFPREQWDQLSHVLIFHGRRVCFAQRPACASCGVNDVCPSAFRAENIGRKAPSARVRTAKRAKILKVAKVAKVAKIADSQQWPRCQGREKCEGRERSGQDQAKLVGLASTARARASEVPEPTGTRGDATSEHPAHLAWPPQ